MDRSNYTAIELAYLQPSTGLIVIRPGASVSPKGSPGGCKRAIGLFGA